MWKTAQKMTKRPVKFGTILPELIAVSVTDDYYKDPVERTYAVSNALNQELNELADAGCPVLQMEEPQIHMVPARGKTFGKLGVERTGRRLQQHREGAAGEDRGLVPHLLGQSRRSSASSATCRAISRRSRRSTRSRPMR